MICLVVCYEGSVRWPKNPSKFEEEILSTFSTFHRRPPQTWTSTLWCRWELQMTSLTSLCGNRCGSYGLPGAFLTWIHLWKMSHFCSNRLGSPRQLRSSPGVHCLRGCVVECGSSIGNGPRRAASRADGSHSQTLRLIKVFESSNKSDSLDLFI